MLNQATMDMLTAMKMTAMAAEFANQLKDPAFNELGFEERLGLLINAEWNRRQSNKLNRFIRNAHFAVPSATVEGIEYYEDRKLDKSQIFARSVFPTDDSLLKMLYLAMMDITKKWTGRRQDWSLIHAQMAIYFAERMPE